MLAQKKDMSQSDSSSNMESTTTLRNKLVSIRKIRDTITATLENCRRDLATTKDSVVYTKKIDTNKTRVVHEKLMKKITGISRTK